VVPKLNWSCPSDATWVNPLSSLACANADQVSAPTARLPALLPTGPVAHVGAHAWVKLQFVEGPGAKCIPYWYNAFLVGV